MKKGLKFFFGLLVSIFIICIVTVGVLAIMLDPNELKKPIVSKIENFTDRKVNALDKLSWQFFPTMGVGVHNLVLANPTGFTQGIFASLQDMLIRVKVAPLFHRTFDFTQIDLSNLILNLEKDIN